ncbi:MAG: hypothetical protein KC445_14100 [Anaerolineales bacterium]|nr:hypothetical protein [Anaerolineales bacterium]
MFSIVDNIILGVPEIFLKQGQQTGYPIKNGRSISLARQQGEQTMLAVASREQLPPFRHPQGNAFRNLSQVSERWLPPSLNTPAILSNHHNHTLSL